MSDKTVAAWVDAKFDPATKMKGDRHGHKCGYREALIEAVELLRDLGRYADFAPDGSGHITCGDECGVFMCRCGLCEVSERHAKFLEGLGDE